MFNKVLIVYSCLFALGGCIYNDEPLPKITYDYSSKIAQPKILKPTKNPHFNENIPKNWLPPSQLEKKWIAIVIHHSDTKNGNATIFDKFHRESKHWVGIGYDFVIGNGTNSGDGQVEVTFRWRNQTIGAHCGGTRANWANKYAVGICLVGNFDHTVPTRQQMRSLVKLVKFLQNRYGIPKSRIYGHKTAPGARVTDCPGRYFPIARLKSMLEF
ncbi:MAG: peptidoglycan recognition protein family protein [Planctomycetota bacterium]|jgi:N-acetyl-anhydromuramyl-L-alanine amidase AmpD